MASTIVQFDAPDGLTLTGKLYADGADTIVNGASGDSATERTNNLGTYTITVTEALTGLHHLRVTDANDVTLAKYSVILADDTSTYTAFDPIVSANVANFQTVLDNYSATRGLSGTALPAAVADAAGGLAISDAGGLALDTLRLSHYGGPRGPGVYLNDAAANTNTVSYTDGTVGNPVSTIAAAKTIADALSFDRIYLVNDSDITLAASMADYEFVGIGELTANVVNLGGQVLTNAAFYNLTIQGDGSSSAGRVYAEGCALQDPGAGVTTLNIFASRCGIVDDISVDTSADNVFDACYSLVAGTGTPVITATGAAGTIAIRHYSGGIELKTLSASHNVSYESDGQLVINADCNVNATVAVRGMCSITDNTAGMNNLTVDAVWNRTTYAADGSGYSSLALASVCTEGRLAELDAANLPTDVSALQTDLNNGTDGLGALKTLIDTLTTTVGTAGEGLTNITLANDLSATMKTSVQTAMDAAIDTAIAELGVGAPTATPTLRTGLMLLYMALRNKVDATSSTLEVHNDAGTIVASKALTDDGTTYSEAEMVSG